MVEEAGCRDVNAVGAEACVPPTVSSHAAAAIHVEMSLCEELQWSPSNAGAMKDKCIRRFQDFLSVSRVGA